MTTTNPPRILREILERHRILLCDMPSLAESLEADLAAYVREREAMVREKAAEMDLRPFIYEHRHGVPLMDPGEAIGVYRKAIEAMPLPSDEATP